jgi:UDP-GlcNAc:undecaprenyl-phosphate GlcNAc-1-phosphate transferase
MTVLSMTELESGLSIGSVSVVSLLLVFVPVLVVSWLVTTVATPLVRHAAVAAGVVDRPDAARKLHTKPTAYLGGVAVIAGVLAGVITSYFISPSLPLEYRPVPFAIVIGMIAITFTGLGDDIWGWDPRLKVAGQLVAAAAMAISSVGTSVVEGFFDSLFGIGEIVVPIPTPWGEMTLDVTYWVGTLTIAFFVMGACNAANLIDGLDGLLSGVTGITVIGLLFISVMMAVALTPADIEQIMVEMPSDDLGLKGLDGITLSGARIALGLAVLGAVLGFLPFNWNPATIFLGDTGSLLLGYLTISLILMLGEQGQTYLVVCGLIVFGLPILDTMIAILRRKLRGIPMSVPDANHLHHVIKRRVGTVKRATGTMYLLASILAAVGVLLAWLIIDGHLRGFVSYIVAFIIFGGASGITVIRVQRSKKRAVNPVDAEV